MTEVIVSAPADSDRLDILDYLAANAGYAIAERYNAEFQALYRRLAQFPAAGPRRREFGQILASPWCTHM